MVTSTRRGEGEGRPPSEPLTWRGLWAQWPGPWLKGSFMEAEVLCPDFILAFISLHKHVLSTYCVQAVHCSWPCTHRAAPPWQGPRLVEAPDLQRGLCPNGIKPRPKPPAPMGVTDMSLRLITAQIRLHHPSQQAPPCGLC